VWGRDVLREMEKQDGDRPHPLQSDVCYDEKEEVKNYLEAAFDRARLAGLPKKHERRSMLMNPGSRRVKVVHVVRIRRFANGVLGTEVDRKVIEEAARRDYPDNVVKRLVAHEVVPGSGVLRIRVRWLGFGSAHDTWEPVHQLAEDVPELVEEYLRRCKKVAVCARMLERFFPL